MAEYTELYKQVLSRLEGGGKTLEADLADIEAGKGAAIAGGQQALVSGGLGGTTVMGAVPVSAEKTAGRARLRARGAAEGKYMTAMMSFASLAERSRQATLERQAAMQRLQTQLGAQGRQAELGRIAATGTTQYGTAARTPQKSLSQFMSEFDVRNRGGGGGYADQFPSLYDTTGTQVPDWTGGGGGVSGLMQPGARQSDIMGGETFDMDFGPGTLVGSMEQKTEQAVTAGLPPSAQPSGGMMTAPEYRARHGESASAAALAGRAKAVGTPEGNIRYTKI